MHAASRGGHGTHEAQPLAQPSMRHPAQVLADFRDSMLYALLCSIALRPVKEWLVCQLDASLADPRRSVGGALLGLAVLPLNALVDAWAEGRAILGKWRQAVQEEFQRRQAALRRAAAAGAAAEASPASPRTPRAAAAAASAAKPSAVPVHTMPSLAVYGHAAVRVLKSRWVWPAGAAPARADWWAASRLCCEKSWQFGCPALRPAVHAASRNLAMPPCTPVPDGPARSGASSGSRPSAPRRAAACSSAGFSAAWRPGWPGSGCG